VRLSDLDGMGTVAGTVVDRCLADLDRLWDRTGGLSAAGRIGVLQELFPALIEKHGRAASAGAAEWYDRLRAASGAPGGFRALAAAPYTRAVAGAIGQAVRDGDVGVLRAVASARVSGAAKRTVLASAKHDPVEPKVASIPRGPTTCAWCRMQAGRGWKLTLKMAGRQQVWHGRCDCVMTPSWDAVPRVEGYDPKEYLDEYARAAKQALNEGERGVPGTLKRMRAGTPENQHHPTGGDAAPAKVRARRIDAATVKELEALGGKALPGVRMSRFMDIRDADSARAVLEQLGVLNVRHPALGARLKEVKFAFMPDPADLAEYKAESKTLVFDARAIAPDWLNWAVETRWWHVSASVHPKAANATHEAGHVLAASPKIRSRFIDAVREILGLGRIDAKGVLEEAWRRGLISRYAKENVAEALAEAFMTVELSPGLASEVERLGHRMVVEAGGRSR
jgi:ribosomal protein L7/L12